MYKLDLWVLENNGAKELPGMYILHNFRTFVQSSLKELLFSIPLFFVAMWYGGKILDLNPTD